MLMTFGLIRRILPTFLGAALLALVASAPAHAARGLEIGIQDDDQFMARSDTARTAAFGHARTLGVSVVRANIQWSRVVADPSAASAPAEPVYDFTAYDRLIDEAAANGIRVELTLGGPAPAWATADHKISVDHPDPVRFAQFAGAAAAHFAGRIRAISLWNEPNWYGLLKPERFCGRVTVVVEKKVTKKGKHGKKRKVIVRTKRKRRVCVMTSARVYRGLYRAGYAAVKAAAPTMPVWIGETNPYVNRRKQSTAPLAWIRQLACADGVVKGCTGILRADGYAHHPYAFDRAPSSKRAGADDVTLATLGKLSKQLKKLRSRIRIAGDGSLYLTEFAYYSSGPNAQPPKRRAAWTREAYEIALKTPKVRQLLYYQLIDPAATVRTTWRTGLVTGAGTLHPAYTALAAFAKKRASSLTRPGSPLLLPPAR
jgi:hypothetical protein